MTRPEPREIRLTGYTEDGIEEFLQAMLNRRAFGAVRYGETHPAGTTPYRDHAHSGELSIWAALSCNLRERMIDAAVYCFLAWRNMEDTGKLDGDSPGVVQGLEVKLARGRWIGLNGRRFWPGSVTT